MTDEIPDVVSRARAALDGITPDCWCIADAAEIISDLLAEVERLRDDLRVERITTHLCESVDADLREARAEVERLQQQPVELSASVLADAVKAEVERDELRAEVERLLPEVAGWETIAVDRADTIDRIDADLVVARAEVERLSKRCDEFFDAIEENGKGWDESQAWAAWFAAERDDWAHVAEVTLTHTLKDWQESQAVAAWFAAERDHLASMRDADLLVADAEVERLTAERDQVTAAHQRADARATLHREERDEARDAVDRVRKVCAPDSPHVWADGDGDGTWVHIGEVIRALDGHLIQDALTKCETPADPASDLAADGEATS